MTFACNPDESAGLAEQFSVKVCRYVAFGRFSREIAECDDKSGIGTMLVQLAEDGEKVTAVWDRLDERWIVGP